MEIARQKGITLSKAEDYFSQLRGSIRITSILIEPIFQVEIKMQKDIEEKIIVHHGETAKEVATKMQQKYQLPTKEKEKIEKKIQTHLNKMAI